MPQSQPNTGFGSQQPIDIGQLLQGLLSTRQVNTNNFPGNQQDTSATAQPNAYQKGVDNYRKQAGYNDAQQYHAAGGDLNAMDNHPAMQPQQTPNTPAGDNSNSNNIDPTKLLAGLVSMASAIPSQNIISSPVKNITQNNVDAIGQAATNAAIPNNGIHPLGILLNLVGNLTGVNELNSLQGLAQQKMLGMAQKTAAGQPSEIALPSSEAALKTGSLNAGAPQADVALTKQQTAASQQEVGLRSQEIAAGVYKTKTDRAIQSIQRLQEQRKQVLDQMNEDLQHGPIIGRGNRLNNYRKQLDYYDRQLGVNGGANPQSTTSTPPPDLIAEARKRGLIK